MIWVNTKSNGEKIVFQKNGSSFKFMTFDKDSTESFSSMVSRAKEWFDKNGRSF